MNCPNCKLPAKSVDGKIGCSVCGWFEKIDGEFQPCEPPVISELKAVEKSETKPEPIPVQKPIKTGFCLFNPQEETLEDLGL